MAWENKSLEKDAHLYTGGERARLIIKDSHDRDYKNGNGFLTPAERKALKRMPDSRVRAEYDPFLRIYEDMPRIVGSASISYFQFKCSYEGLKKAHLLLNLSPAVEYLSKLVKEHVVNADARKEALMVADALQAATVNGLGNPVLKGTLKFIVRIVGMATGQAKNFFRLKKEIETIDKIMGFNIFMQDHYAEDCGVFAKEIRFCIREHNGLMAQFGAGMPDLNDYFISDPENDDNKQQGEKNA